MTGDTDLEEPREPAWHERTSTLAWASVAALIALWLLYLIISFVARQFGGPDEEVPQYFLDPGAPTTSHGFSTTTTTSPSYTTPSGQTSDINPSDTTSTSPTSPTSPTTPNATTRRHTPTSDDEARPSSRRPRFNETRRPFFTP